MSHICAHWVCSSASTHTLRACMVRLMPRKILMPSTNCGCIPEPEDADPAWEAELPGELAVEPLLTLGGVWTWTW